MFKEYVGKLKAMVGEEKTKTILSKGVFLVVAGSDDIANSYFVMGIRKRQYDIPAYTDLMLSSASSFLKVFLMARKSSMLFPFLVHRIQFLSSIY